MKPCPFCGKDRYVSPTLVTVDFRWQYGDNLLPKPWHVQCVNCGSYGPSASSPAEAEALWDSRAIVHECCLPDDAKD